jgi:integrase/recombinase XerD
VQTGIAKRQETRPARATIGAQFLAGQLSPATARAYRADAADFFGKPCEELTPDDLRAVTPADVTAWRNDRMQAQSPATVARKLSTLRSLFRTAEALGIVAESPLSNGLVRSPKVSNESQTAGLTGQQARALLDAITGDGLTAKRDRAMVELILRTGLRRAEAVNADREDLGEERGHTVLTVTGKGGKRESVKVPVTAKRALDEYLAARADDHPALFVSHARNGHAGERLSTKAVYRQVKHYAEKAGIEKAITPHSLRHTFVTLALDGGATVRQVQAAARHADPKTTIRYDRNRRNLDDHASDYVHF